jgi:hypothetical protein
VLELPKIDVDYFFFKKKKFSSQCHGNAFAAKSEDSMELLISKTGCTLSQLMDRNPQLQNSTVIVAGDEVCGPYHRGECAASYYEALKYKGSPTILEILLGSKQNETKERPIMQMKTCPWSR